MTCQNVQQSQSVHNSQNTPYSQYLRGFLAGTAATGAVVTSAVIINSFIFSSAAASVESTKSLILDQIMNSSSLTGGSVGALGGVLLGTYYIGKKVQSYTKFHILERPSICGKLFDISKIMTWSTFVAAGIGASIGAGIETSTGTALLTTAKNILIT